MLELVYNDVLLLWEGMPKNYGIFSKCSKCHAPMDIENAKDADANKKGNLKTQEMH